MPADHRWVEVDTAPCALDDEGRVYCWNSASWPWLEGDTAVSVPVNVRPMRRLVAPTTELVVGTRTADGIAEVWHCPIGAPLLDAPWCHPPGYPVELAGSACGRRADGEVVYWWQSDEPRFVSDDFPGTGPYRIAAGTGGECAAVDAAGGVFVSHSWGAPWYQATFDLPVNALVWTLQGVCALHPNGSVSCLPSPDHTGELHVFTTGPYQRLVGGMRTVCAQRLLDHVIECNDGQTFNFGPVTDLAAYTFDERGVPHSNPTAHTFSASVCAITEANEIRCEGTRFPPDLRSLPPEGWIAPEPGEFP